MTNNHNSPLNRNPNNSYNHDIQKNENEDTSKKSNIQNTQSYDIPSHRKYSLSSFNEQSNKQNFDVHSIIERYGNQPELLELILSCKVQEDKRKTEEAKLKQKEIDYLMLNEEEFSRNMGHVKINHDSEPIESRKNPPISNTRNFDKGKQKSQSSYSSSPENSPSGYRSSLDDEFALQSEKTSHTSIDQPQASNRFINYNSRSISSSSLRRSSLQPIVNNLSPPTSHPQRFSEPYLFKARSEEDERQKNHLNILPPLDFTKSKYQNSLPTDSFNSQHSNTTPTTPHVFENPFPSKESPTPESSESLNRKKRKSVSTLTEPNPNQYLGEPFVSTSEAPKKLLLPINRSSRFSHSSSSTNLTRSRRRKEMQPITMIIETKEFPYDDQYIWKNNGNTIHKTSGQKSIYYKCSNSTMGCTVNKTVAFKENGEYIIKYRGHHLEECSRIKKKSVNISNV